MCYRLPVRWKLVEKPFIPGARSNRKLTHTQVGPQDRTPSPQVSAKHLWYLQSYGRSGQNSVLSLGS